MIQHGSDSPHQRNEEITHGAKFRVDHSFLGLFFRTKRECEMKALDQLRKKAQIQESLGKFASSFEDLKNRLSSSDLHHASQTSLPFNPVLEHPATEVSCCIDAIVDKYNSPSNWHFRILHSSNRLLNTIAVSGEI